MRVMVQPTDEHPLPFDMAADEAGTLEDRLAVAGNTAEMLVSLGAKLPNVKDRDLSKTQTLLRNAVEGDGDGLTNLTVAIGAGEFIREYGKSLALDITEVRHALTNKLLELANCGKPQYELRAIELLGKHSDIGLFTQRSEINVNYNTPEALEAAIREKVRRLLKGDVVNLPLGKELDEELALLGRE